MLCCTLLFSFGLVVTQPASGFEVSQIQQGAQSGNMNDAYFLGVMYRTGGGVTASCDEAFKWTQQAAEQGHVLAQSHLGALYKAGCDQRIDQEPYQAYFWTALAAQQGLEFAQIHLPELEQQLHPYLVAEAKRKIAEFKPKASN